MLKNNFIFRKCLEITKIRNYVDLKRCTMLWSELLYSWFIFFVRFLVFELWSILYFTVVSVQWLSVAGFAKYAVDANLFLLGSSTLKHAAYKNYMKKRFMFFFFYAESKTMNLTKKILCGKNYFQINSNLLENYCQRMPSTLSTTLLAG